jgi:hypothetical protein
MVLSVMTPAVRNEHHVDANCIRCGALGQEHIVRICRLPIRYQTIDVHPRVNNFHWLSPCVTSPRPLSGVPRFSPYTRGLSLRTGFATLAASCPSMLTPRAHSTAAFGFESTFRARSSAAWKSNRSRISNIGQPESSSDVHAEPEPAVRHADDAARDADV